MVESELLVSPRDTSDAVSLSQSGSQKVFRKRILPMATINYRGRKISFDRQYLTDLAQSFDAGAYDQVPFMLADASNTHTMDVERMRGEVTGVEVADDGLYATIQVTGTAVGMLEQHPKLGVSARILENYERSDGKNFPRALQHVLATTDPVISGLGDWEEVALSNLAGGAAVLDLSATSYEELGTGFTDSTDTKEEPVATRQEHLQQVAKAADMTVEDLESLGMTDDELAIFASAFAVEAPPAAENTEDGEELTEEAGSSVPLLDETADGEIPTDAEIEAAVDALTDEELTALAAELGLTDEEEAEASEEAGEEEAAAETETEAAAEETAETEETPAEPTDAELADRLGAGEFGSGLGDEDPSLGTDTELDENVSDEDWAALWEAAVAKDADGTETNVEEEAVAEEAAAEAAATAAAEAEQAAESEETPQLVGAGAVTLSNESGPELVALSNQVNTLQHQLAQQAFVALRAEYIRKGVPAALVDLARPVLVAGQSATLEFSNAAGETQQVDTAGIVRQLLDSATGYIDLARERGHGYSLEGEDRKDLEAAEDQRLVSLWAEQYGN